MPWVFGSIEAEGAEIDDIRDPVDEKYLSASSASSRKTFADVPILDVCASWVRISLGNCLRNDHLRLL